jgi:hypothetical protein
MRRPFPAILALAALPLLAAPPAHALAATHPGSAAQVHHLPSAGSSPVTVFSFGIKGGTLRPWSVSVGLDGSIAGVGVQPFTDKLADPQSALSGLLTLADAEGFFSMGKVVGCTTSVANPDVSARSIKIKTSTGTKSVSAYGTCNAKFNQLYAVLEGVAGVSR